MRLDRHVEIRQQPTDSPPWHETHQLLILEPDQRLVVLRLTVWPNLGTAECVAVRAEPGSRAVILHDDELPVPADRWEFRSSGIWVELVCETPLVHWSCGLEAFALEIDSPTQLMTRSVGDRVPMGWELEFESRDAAIPLESPVAGYTQAGIAHGLLLSAAGESPLQGSARRWHWWEYVDPPLTELFAGDHSRELAASPDVVAAIPRSNRALEIRSAPGHVMVADVPPPS